ncbi:orotate phosphoribosyltransferase [Luminiphilus sp.]|nr:orotate phosphoribosyltransferase [Luminiphilus sp.]MDA8678847.1 orotate phosphoribosyltransferase [Luminiphilus sp.]MDC0411318.1 orotate phosphoribosyltransferase [Luminiphilus sp.]
MTTASQHYRQDFIRLALACNVLQFGEFELKSGRVSPYFFNAGKFASGSSLAQLGRCYAAALQAANLPADMLFGPAYKGIPLVATTAIALADHHDVDMPFAFNRKEAKAHGEGGQVVGAPLQGNVLIVDDVMTAGTAIKESMAILEAAGATGAGVLIGLDRCERGTAELSAVQQVQQDWGLDVISVISLHDIIEWVEDNPEAIRHRDALQRYRDRYVSA